MNSDSTTTNREAEIFSNTGINPESLPDVANIEFSPLSPRYRSILFLRAGLFSLLLGFAAGVGASQLPYANNLYLVIGPGMVVFFAALQTLFILKGFPWKGYALRERDIAYRTGWIWRSETIVPFGRIQHGELTQSFVDRAFRLQKFKIFTAGGSGSDLVIPGLPEKLAKRIRAHVMERIVDEIDLEDSDHNDKSPSL